MKYTAIEKTELGTGQGVNGTGVCKVISGAYTLDPRGRRCRAFSNSEGGIDAARKWATFCNENFAK